MTREYCDLATLGLPFRFFSKDLFLKSLYKYPNLCFEHILTDLSYKNILKVVGGEGGQNGEGLGRVRRGRWWKGQCCCSANCVQGSLLVKTFFSFFSKLNKHLLT